MRNLKDIDIDNLETNGRVSVYYGLEGYVKSMQLRVQDGIKEIRQIVNGEKVVKFHKASDYLVKEVIGTRVQKGIVLKNLISKGDDVLAIEKSNPATLKEARLLPDNIVSENMIAIFEDIVTITSLDLENTYTVIIKDFNTAKTFSEVFDVIWKISKVV